VSKPSVLQKLEREIGVLRLLKHPAVLRLYDFYEAEAHLYVEIFSYCMSSSLFVVVLTTLGGAVQFSCNGVPLWWNALRIHRD